MQFQPPSQPGWSQSEPGQQSFPPQQLPSQPLPMQSTGYYPWSQQQGDAPPQQPVYPPQQPFYPPQPQQWPPMQPMPYQKPRSAFKLGLGVGCGFMAAIALVIVVIAVLASASSHNNTVTSTTPGGSQSTPAANQSTSVPTTQPTSAPTQTILKVGETGSNNLWSMSLNKVSFSTGDSFLPPKAGNIYLVVDVTVTNLASTPQDISSVASFVLQDSTGQVYTETYAGSGNGTPPDGTLQPSTKLRGQLIYEVPKSEQNFTLQFQGNGFDGTSGTSAFSM